MMTHALARKDNPMNDARRDEPLAEPVSVYLRVKGSPDRGHSLAVALRKVMVDGAPFWAVLTRAVGSEETLASATLCRIEDRPSIIHRDITTLLDSGLIAATSTVKVCLSSGARVQSAIALELARHLGVDPEFLKGAKTSLAKPRYTIAAPSADWVVRKHPEDLLMMGKGYQSGKVSLEDLLALDLYRILQVTEFWNSATRNPVESLSLEEVRTAYRGSTAGKMQYQGEAAEDADTPVADEIGAGVPVLAETGPAETGPAKTCHPVAGAAPPIQDDAHGATIVMTPKVESDMTAPQFSMRAITFGAVALVVGFFTFNQYLR